MNGPTVRRWQAALTYLLLCGGAVVMLPLEVAPSTDAKAAADITPTDTRTPSGSCTG